MHQALILKYLRGLKQQMSASREKQNRQAQAGQTNPKTAREAQQRREQKRSSILYGLIALAFVAVVIVSLIWRTDIIPRMSTAAVIDGESYNAAEVNYYYQSAYRNFVNQNSDFISYFGLDTSSSLKSQTVNETAAAMLGLELEEGETQTWHDYFLDQALNNMTVIQASLKAAEAEGYAYPDGVQVQYEDSMSSLRSAAAASGMSVGQYLKGNFGAGITEKVYGEQLLRVLRYSAYAKSYQKSLVYSDSDLEAVYNEDRNSYDHVSYENATISGAAESTTDADGNTVEPTEEESAAAMETARATANEMLDAVENGEALEDLAETHDTTYYNNESGAYSTSVMSQWLFDDARKDGDAAVLEDGSTVYVVVFHGRSRNEDPRIDIRHILVSLGAGTIAEGEEGYEDEQAQLKADAHAKAEELLAQWQSGAATEDSFGALAMAESADGSKYDGGLYTNVYEGRMVTEFNDWCFDSARKPGDTGIVDTQYGAHVMYFVGSGIAWKTQASTVLQNEDYTEWEDGLVEGVSAELRSGGLKFVG